jgi:hypothetical protein
MYSRRLHLALAVLLLSALALSAKGQKPAEVWAEWETLTPDNEEFTVLMPKNPTTESTTFPYHKMQLSARTYMASSSAGPVLAIASLSGIKSDPAQYTEFARFNSYIDAFKTFFPPKVRSKETLVKMTLVNSRPFHGYTGRSYKLALGDLNGSVNAFVTKKRFYAIVFLNTKKDDGLEDKFLSSFVLPDRQPDTPKNTAAGNNADQPNAQGQQETANQANNVAPEGEPNAPENANAANNNTADATPANVPANPAPQNNGPKRGPVSGGMLNSKAIYLPMPEIPPGEASGVVLVAIVVDEGGAVIEARAVSGPQHLHAAAVNAARLARFAPTLLMGEPVRVSGTLSFNFVRSN